MTGLYNIAESERFWALGYSSLPFGNGGCSRLISLLPVESRVNVNRVVCILRGRLTVQPPLPNGRGDAS